MNDDLIWRRMTRKRLKMEASENMKSLEDYESHMNINESETALFSSLVPSGLKLANATVGEMRPLEYNPSNH